MSESETARVSHPFRWFPEFLEFGKRRIRSQGRVLGASVLVGIVAGIGGIVFSVAGQAVVGIALEGAAGYEPAGPAGEVRFPWIPSFHTNFNPWLLLVVPAVGGLLSGLLVYRFAPEAEGHGTDAAIAAYHEHQGYIRPRVPIIKLIASALTIGTGGSGGREGPIAQIGAGFGSLLGGMLRLRPAERRVLLAAGMGAGIAAIFRAPLAGTLFAAEIMYCSPEFEPEVILPTGLASVVSYCTFGVLATWLGGTTTPWRPLFTTASSLEFSGAWELLPYSLLAIWMAVLAMIYVRSFYAVNHVFESLRMPKALKPALGAAARRGRGAGNLLRRGQAASCAFGPVVRIRSASTGTPGQYDALCGGAAGDRGWQDLDDEFDDRERWIGRCVWSIDGHWRLCWGEPRRIRAPDVAIGGAPSGGVRDPGDGGFLCGRRQDSVFDAGDRE